MYNSIVREPRCIRYFSNLKKAESAREVLIDAGFEVEVKEDKFGDITLDKLGFPLRFRLYVERNDIKSIAKLLAGKLKGGE